jgi:hypothetical protein
MGDQEGRCLHLEITVEDYSTAPGLDVLLDNHVRKHAVNLAGVLPEAIGSRQAECRDVHEREFGVGVHQGVLG